MTGASPRLLRRRLVVRFTNRTVVCQVAYATMAGDKVVSAAYR